MTHSRLRSLVIIIFSATYLCFQLTMIVTAHTRDDKRLGFWMFAESSNFNAVLYRELENGQRVRVPHGVWTVQGRSGEPITYQWNRLVREFHLGYLEEWVHAKTGIHVTLKYFQNALNFVIDRIPEDRDTVQLHLSVRYSKAGATMEEVVLSSKRREHGAEQ